MKRMEKIVGRYGAGHWLGLMGLLLVAACSGPPQAERGEFAVIAIEAAGDVVGAQATVLYDADTLEFAGVAAADPGVLVAAHARDGSVKVALVSVAGPKRGALAQLSFRVKAPGDDPALAELAVVEPAGGLVALEARATPAFGFGENPAAGYSLAGRAEALATQLGLQAVLSQPELEASFADFPLGDLDRSGSVDLVDAVTLAAIATGAASSPSDYELYHGDLNSNGVVNTFDVAALLLKVVEPDLEAELQVAPKVLNLEPGTSSLILVGNAGNMPLPDITITPPSGVSVTDISGENAAGRAFAVEVTGAVVGSAIVFDAGLAGTRVVALESALCEAFEPNNSFEEAAPLEPGTIVAAICSEFDVDWYSVTLETPRVVSLEAGLPAGSSLNALYGTLYDAQRNHLNTLYAFRDDFEDYWGAITVYLPPGTYYLALSGSSFSGNYFAASYSLRFDAAEPEVAAVFEASAGTANLSDPYGTLEANLLALSARQDDGTSLPYDVLVNIEVPGHGTFPVYYPTYYGPALYQIVDFETLVNPPPPPPDPTDPEALKRLAERRAQPSKPGLPFLRSEPRSEAAISPAAITGGTFTFIFPDTTIRRTVDPGQRLELPMNATATLSDDRAAVSISFDPVPGAVEYTIAVQTSQGSVFAISDGPPVTVPLDHLVSEWDSLFISIIAADFTGLIDPVAERFGLPIPEAQINISATLLELTFERPTVIVRPGESIQAALNAASPGSQISLAPGLYQEAVTIDKPGIMIMGSGGFDGHGEEVVLENPGGEANGVTVTPNGRGVEIVNLTIHDFGENGIFLEEVDGFRISGVAAHNNGEYGFYPIRSSNGVIENCRASGHSDAGVYVGRRSHDITIRNCVTFENVTGIEITNSSFISAYGNDSFNNIAGFLVALLPAFPGAPPVSVTGINLSYNYVYDNNLPNFADHGLEQHIPSGSGMLIIGIDDSIIEYNTVTGNGFVGIGVGNTGLLAQLADVPVGDDIEPFPDGVRVIGNTVTGNGGTQPIDFLPPEASVDLLWDGTGTGNCWSGNDFDSSLNLDLPGGSPSVALPECD